MFLVAYGHTIIIFMYLYFVFANMTMHNIKTEMAIKAVMQKATQGSGTTIIFKSYNIYKNK